MRMLVYTGKGGVGKTTVAAATAVRCAENNRRTLIIGCDPSQSLADCLNVPLSDDPAEIASNLWAQEIDPLVRLERGWPELEIWLAEVFRTELAGTTIEELTIGPGLGDLIRLLALKQHLDENSYDVVVLDASSSLSALQMLSYPEGAAWWLAHLLGINGENRSPLADRSAELIDQLVKLRASMGDGAECSVRIVTTPEQLALRETQRALTFANLYGYHVDAIVLNRQKRVPKSVADIFSAWPILSVTLYDRDIIGQKLLRELALALFPPPMDPADVLISGQAERLSKGEDGYLLSLKLPFVHEDDIDLLQHRNQLILQVGRMRRVIRLSEPLEGLQAGDAVLEDGTLEIHFRQ